VVDARSAVQRVAASDVHDGGGTDIVAGLEVAVETGEDAFANPLKSHRVAASSVTPVSADGMAGGASVRASSMSRAACSVVWCNASARSTSKSAVTLRSSATDGADASDSTPAVSKEGGETP